MLWARTGKGLHLNRKQLFLTAVRDYITERFYLTLKETADNCSDSSKTLVELGKSYVTFFYENPLYYGFLFSRDDIDTTTYPPFLLFQSIAENVIDNTSDVKLSDSDRHAKAITLLGKRVYEQCRYEKYV